LTLRATLCAIARLGRHDILAQLRIWQALAPSAGPADARAFFLQGAGARDANFELALDDLCRFLDFTPSWTPDMIRDQEAVWRACGLA
jgi:hypothetical protein